MQPATFGGPGFVPRRGSLRDELARGQYFAPYRVENEWAPLLAVQLYRPGPAIERIRDHDAMLHLGPIDRSRLLDELEQLRDALEHLGVSVVAHQRPAVDDARYANLLYQRDLFSVGPEGCLLGRPASRARAGEEVIVQRLLSELCVPIVFAPTGDCSFECADLIWLDSGHALCAVGARTTKTAFRQLRASLRARGIVCESVDAPRSCQHLLGALQVVSPTRALVRSACLSRRARRTLEAYFELLDVPEGHELTERRALNLLVVAPDRVVMTDDCPGFEALLARHHIAVAAQVPTAALRRGGGGITCATGILARRSAEVSS
jgi:N-dimethylarginine dimethylaminohydrolase